MKIKIECPDCGKIRHLFPSKFKIRKTHLCGKCFSIRLGNQMKGNLVSESGENNPNWKGGFRYWSQGRFGKDKDGLSWRKQRQFAQERADGKCQLCGMTEKDNGRKLDTDHKIPWRVSFSHNLDNLWCVCRYCHGKEESKRPEYWENNKIFDLSNQRNRYCRLCKNEVPRNFPYECRKCDDCILLPRKNQSKTKYCKNCTGSRRKLNEDNLCLECVRNLVTIPKVKELRIKGLSFPKIGRILDISAMTACYMSKK